MRLVTAFAGLLLLTQSLHAQQTLTKSLTAADGTFIGFYEFRPADYSSQAKHPMIIFLSGYGEKGNGTTDLPLLHCCGLPSYIRRGHPMEFTWNGKRESFVVLIPQLSPRYTFWQSFYVNELIRYAAANLNIDPDRIFLTGLSLGGGGTWSYASESKTNAQKLAGIVPVVGPCTMTNGCNIAEANLPVLAVHSVDDQTASPECTTGAIADIIACNAAAVPNLIMYPNGGHAVWLRRAYSTDHEYQEPNIYEWMLAQNRSLLPNKKPRANAGADITLNGSSSANLNGAASSDDDGNIVQYRWRKLEGPAGDTSINSEASSTVIEDLYKAGTYRYELKVIDNRAEWDLDTITIVSLVDVVEDNQRPIAWAGRGTILFMPVSEVTLDGSYSLDPDGTIEKYLWEPISGPDTAYIDDARQMVTKARNFIIGEYRFRLTVTDNRGKRSSHSVKFDIREENILPVARAGSDTILLSAGEIILDGTASFDVDGSVNKYSWRKIEGADAQIEYANDASTRVTFTTQDVYLFELEVTDDAGGTGRDTVRVEYVKVDDEVSGIRLYPNPAGSSVRLQVNNDEQGQYTIAVYDMMGRQVIKKRFFKNAFSAFTNIDTQQLQPGVYTLQLSGSDKVVRMLLMRRR